MEPEPENPNIALRGAMDGIEMEFEQEKANNAWVYNTEGGSEPSSPDRKARANARAPSESSDESEEEIKDLGTRKTLFFLFWLSTMFLNIDTGVIPTAQL